jgi:hypothetical protein
MKIRCHERCQSVHRLECQLYFLPPLTARFDVFVSHEGSDPEVRKLVLDLGNRHLVLGYVAHKKAKSIDGPDSAHVAFGGGSYVDSQLGHCERSEKSSFRQDGRWDAIDRSR